MVRGGPERSVTLSHGRVDQRYTEQESGGQTCFRKCSPPRLPAACLPEIRPWIHVLIESI